jgi:hypothetical protein
MAVVKEETAMNSSVVVIVQASCCNGMTNCCQFGVRQIDRRNVRLPDCPRYSSRFHPAGNALRRMSEVIWPRGIATVCDDAAGRSPRPNCSSFDNGLGESLSQDLLTDRRRGCVRESTENSKIPYLAASATNASGFLQTVLSKPPRRGCELPSARRYLPERFEGKRERKILCITACC